MTEPVVPNPSRGGSYTRDPVTHELTQVEGTEPADLAKHVEDKNAPATTETPKE